MSRFRFFFALFASLFLVSPLLAADNPVSWSAQLDPKDARPGEGGRVVLTAKIEEPWHIYAPTTPDGGPIPTKIELAPNKILTLSGKIAQPKPLSKKDEGFGIMVETFTKSVSFGLPVKIAANAPTEGEVKVKIRYQACNERVCLPPKKVEVPVEMALEFGPPPREDHLKPNTSVPPQTAQKEEPKKAEPKEDEEDDETEPANAGAVVPPNDAPKDGGEGAANAGEGIVVQKAGNSGLLPFLGLAFTSGLLALLTPCVFPMIPITVSFFAKQNENNQSGKSGLKGPIAYCLGIIGTFTAVGVLASIAFGASGITSFATNPYVNLGLAILFIVLALNLFGVYEIVVPSAILNKVQPNGKKGGIVTPLLMGLAFSLTSFTCTVPFVGTALAAAATGDKLYPALGMMAFSTAFAAPFFLLALFPGWLAKLPRAGQWLVSVKAFMGFLELAAALKFLSNADMVWQLGLLTRPVFLALWAMIFAIAGFYLLGWLRLPKDALDLKIGPFRRALGVATVLVGVFFLSALGSLKLNESRFLLVREFESYLPPPEYGATEKPHDSTWLVNDYESAKQRAKAENKPLLINFTGYTCTNCRLMERTVLPHPDVKAELGDFVPVELYTDGANAQSNFSALQQEKFGTVAVPMYVVISPDGKVNGRLEGLERSPQKFAEFLRNARSEGRLAANN